MPTYVYRCKKCKHTFELFHSITDESVKRCPRCRSKAERIPAGGAGILFKGSGFYITDYRSASYREKAKQDQPAASGSTSAPSGGTSGAGEGGGSGKGEGSAGTSSGGTSSGAGSSGGSTRSRGRRRPRPSGGA